jgi:hypothetical protein
VKAKPRAKQSRLNLEELFPDYPSDWWDGALFFDDMDDAFIGFATQSQKAPVAVYEREACLQCLVKTGMTDEEAIEWFEYNTVGAWVGERTPMIITFKDKFTTRSEQ